MTTTPGNLQKKSRLQARASRRARVTVPRSLILPHIAGVRAEDAGTRTRSGDSKRMTHGSKYLLLYFIEFRHLSQSDRMIGSTHEGGIDESCTWIEGTVKLVFSSASGGQENQAQAPGMTMIRRRFVMYSHIARYRLPHHRIPMSRSGCPALNSHPAFSRSFDWGDPSRQLAQFMSLIDGKMPLKDLHSSQWKGYMWRAW